MKLRTTLTLGITIAGITAGVFYYSNSKQSISRTSLQTSYLASSTQAAKPVAGEPTAFTAPAISQNSQAVQTPLAATTEAALLPQPIPVEINEILPDLQEPLSDWREYKPNKIRIAAYPGQDIEFTATSIRDEFGRTIWNGRTDIEGAFLVTVATAEHWQATLALPSANSTYEFLITGATAVKKVTPHQLEKCADAPKMVNSSRRDNFVPPELRPGPSTEADNHVDLLVFYDADTLAAEDNNASRVESRIIRDIESSNKILENSHIDTFRWRYIGTTYQVPSYTAGATLPDDLKIFSNFDGQSETPVSKFAEEKAVKHGADQIMLYIGRYRNDGIWGVAWLGNGPSALQHKSVVFYGATYMTFTHELGHNFGCHHDRQEPSSEATDGDGKYNYGHRFLSGTRDEGTVMSYADYRYPAFSNPAVTYEGHIMGVANDQPRAANNALVLMETGQAMADTLPSQIRDNTPDWKIGSGPTIPEATSGTTTGGGAPSLWFLAALAALTIVRTTRQATSRKS